MDIISHGLWGGLLFGRKNAKSFWLSFAFGVMPDFLVFAPPFALAFIGILSGHGGIRMGPPDVSSIPHYVFAGYNITHSFVVFAAAFFLVWLVRRKPVYEMLAWPAHIALDMPLHSTEFFPTPYLWPFPYREIDGIPWSHPAIIIPDILLLAALYLWFFVIRRRLRKNAAADILARSEEEGIDK